MAPSRALKIFFDTEFLEHKKGYGVEAVSIGLVSETGDELYVVFNNFDTAHAKPWTIEHVLKKLPPEEMRLSLEEVKNKTGEWLTALRRKTGADKVEFWAKNGSYDAFILCQTFGGMSSFKDFFQLLGVQRAEFRDTNEIRRQAFACQLSPQPEATEHIAIDDARWEKIHYDEMMNFLRHQPAMRAHFNGPSGMA